MLFRSASHAILWYSFVALPSDSASFCICASLNGGMYTPPVLPVTVAGWSTSTLALGFCATAGLAAAAAAAAGGAATVPPLSDVLGSLPPPSRESLSRSFFWLPRSRPRSCRPRPPRILLSPRLRLRLRLRRLRLESRRVLPPSSLLLLLLLLVLLLLRRRRPFPVRSLPPFRSLDAAADPDPDLDPDPFEPLVPPSSLGLFPSSERPREASRLVLALPLSPLLPARVEPSSDEEPEEELEEEEEEEEEEDESDDADLPRFLLLSDILLRYLGTL